MNASTNTSYVMSYKNFRKLVNKKVDEIAGVGIDELDDFDLYAYFSENESLTEAEWDQLASEAANDALDNDGFPFDEP